MEEPASRLEAAPEPSRVPAGFPTLFLGLVLVAVGVALSIRAELGVAPFDVFTTGIVSLAGVHIGVAAIITPIVFVGVAVLLGGRVQAGTLIAVVVVGPVLGVVLPALPEQEAMVPRLGYYGTGFVVLALGITAVIVADVGPGPAELLMLAVHARGVAISPARTIIEVVSVTLGWIMGGQVGIGTVIFAFLIGPVLQRLLTAAGFSPRAAEVRSDLAGPGA